MQPIFINAMGIANKVKFISSLLMASFGKNNYFPVFAGLSLTRRCNYKCKYCNEWNNLCPELNTRQIFSIIDELASLGTKIIGFDGGEPLLREDIGRIVGYAKRRNFVVALNTNGSLVPEKISELKDVDMLDISFEGPEEIHDYIRGKNSYREIMTAVDFLKKNNIPLKFNCTLSKYNINCIDFILEKSAELGIEVKFSALHYVHAWKDELLLNPAYPAVNDYKRALERLIKYKRNNRQIANSMASLRYLYAWPQADKKLKCFASKLFCRIEPNGDMYPCTMLRHEAKPVNCTETGVKKAFEKLFRADCIGCWCTGTLELNYLLSLEISTVLNNVIFIKNFFKKNL